MADHLKIVFSETEAAGRGFNQDAGWMSDTTQRLRNATDRLYGSGLRGSFVNTLDVRLDDFFRTLRYLCDEVNEMGDDLRAVADMAQQVDHRAALRFNARGNPINAPFTDGSSTVASSPWYVLRDTSDGGWNGAHPTQAKAIVVNGIQNMHDDMHGLMQSTSKELGGVPVLGIYNATGGKNRGGIVSDVAQAISDKFQVFTGVRIGPDNPAVVSLMGAVQATNDSIPIFAHSQGGAITAAAMWELHRKGVDLSHVRIITMGSAEFHFPPEVNVEHWVHLNDPVPMVAGARLDRFVPSAANFAWHPLTLTKGVITGNVKMKTSPTPNPHSAEGYFQSFDL
jgi:uncharacterized protein YukE